MKDKIKGKKYLNVIPSKLVFAAALLIALAEIPASVSAQSVTFEICNVGTVDIDVFAASSGSHIRPTSCEIVAQSEGGGMEPVSVGIAFTDSRGKWGAARRLGLIPYMGVKELPLVTRLAMNIRDEPLPRPPHVLSLANTIETVRHGNTDVSLPMQLLFQPPYPECRTVSTGGGASFGNTQIVEVTNICEDLVYTLKVEAYPDSREIRLAALPVAGAVSQDGPVTISEMTDVNWAEENEKRKEREQPPAVNWSDLLAVLRRARSWELLPKHIVIRGTVSSVDVSPYPVGPDTNIDVVNVVLRESPFVRLRADWEPYSEFNVCTARPDIFEEVFGADFRTSMIGKAIEVRGETGAIMGADGSCRGQLSSIYIILARQVRPVDSVQFPAGTPFWVPPPEDVKPLPPPPSIDELAASIADGARHAAWQAEEQKKSEMRTACIDQANKAYAENPANSEANNKEYYACLDAAKRYPLPPVANMEPIVVNSYEDYSKIMQEQNERAAQERTAAHQRRIEKAKPCAQKLLKAFPDGGYSDSAGFHKGFLACVEVQSAP